MLALMVWLYHDRGGQMPNNRSALYKECSTLMFRRWDEERRIMADIPPDFDLLNLLSALAPRFYLSKELAGGVDQKGLTTAIRDHFIQEYGHAQDRRSTISAEKVVSFITGRAWVMTDKGPGVYDFNHRTFLEYFFARHLDDTHETIDDLFAELAPHIVDGEWNVAAHLAIQRKIEGRPTLVRRIAEHLLQLVGQEGVQDNPDVITFVAQALDYVQAAEPLMEELAGCVTRSTLASDASMAEVDRLIRNTTPKSEAVFRGIAKAVAEMVSSKMAVRQNGKFFDFIYKRRMCAQLIPEWEQRYRYGNLPQLLNALSSIVGPELYEQAEEDVVAARNAFQLVGHVPINAPSFGLRLWEAPILRQRRADWLLFDIMMMLRDIANTRADVDKAEVTPHVKLGLAISPAFYRGPFHLPNPSVLLVSDWAPQTFQGLGSRDYHNPETLLAVTTFVVAARELMSHAYGSQFRNPHGHPLPRKLAEELIDRTEVALAGSRDEEINFLRAVHAKKRTFFTANMVSRRHVELVNIYDF